MLREQPDLFQQIVDAWGPERAEQLLRDAYRTMKREHRDFELSEKQIREIWSLAPHLFPESWTLPPPNKEGRLEYEEGQKEGLMRILRTGTFPCKPIWVQQLFQFGFQHARTGQPVTKT